MCGFGHLYDFTISFARIRYARSNKPPSVHTSLHFLPPNYKHLVKLSLPSRVDENEQIFITKIVVCARYSFQLVVEFQLDWANFTAPGSLFEMF